MRNNQNIEFLNVNWTPLRSVSKTLMDPLKFMRIKV